MKKEEFDLLEKFIEKDLSSEEMISVKKLIASNKSLSKELQLRIDVNKALMEKDVMKLRSDLKIIYAEFERSQSGKVQHLISRNWHLAAASIAVLIMVGSFLLSNLNRLSTDRIYEKYYTTEDAVITSRSGNFENSQLNIAVDKFQNNEFIEAIELLSPFKENHLAQYYLGLSFMETKQFSNANKSFKKILEQKDNIFIEQAKWYKALCLLKLNDKEAASKLFSSILEDNNLYTENARAILKMIK